MPLLKHRNLSGGVFFADIATACYAVIRELVMGLTNLDDEEAMARLFAFTGCSPEEFTEFKKLLATPAQEEAGASQHLMAMVSAAQEDTWSIIQGCKNVAANRSGTRPGDSIADVTYAFIDSKRRKPLSTG